MRDLYAAQDRPGVADEPLNHARAKRARETCSLRSAWRASIIFGQSLDKRAAQPALNGCVEQEFDGHTDFERMSISRRLDWLGQAIVFVNDFKGVATRANDRRRDHAG